MTNAERPDVYMGRRAVDRDGNKIGTVGQVYVNDETGVPDWVTVNTGLFGLRESFVPVAGSTFDGDDVVLPFDKDVVKDSPVVDADHLDEDEQQLLYSYYERYLDVAGSGSRTRTAGTRNDVRGGRRKTGSDTSGRSTDDAMTRSEEQLRVGTEQVPAGRARLRKYVVTEEQSVQVPVSRGRGSSGARTDHRGQSRAGAVGTGHLRGRA